MKLSPFKWFVLAVFSTMAASAWAGIDFVFPAPQDTLPSKFSGTNCIASAQFYVSGTTERVLRSELFLKSGSTEVLVHEAEYPVLLPKPVDGFLRVRFASTHFNHGSNVTIKMMVHTDQASYWAESASIPVHNKGIAYEHGDFAGLTAGTGVLAAEIELEAMKHNDIVPERNSTWTKGMFLADLSTATALHLGTHGTSSWLYANGTSNNTFGEVEVNNSRQGVFPKINVAMLDVCLIGNNTSVLAAFLQATFESNVVDQAVVAFKVVVNSKASMDFDSEFWSLLTDKLTFGQGVAEAIEAYNKAAKGITSYEVPELRPEDVRLYGDPKTTLNRVYTGNQDIPTPSWYLRLNQ